MNHDDVTAMLVDIRKGDPTHVGDFFPLVYNELRRIARRELQRQRGDYTVRTTGLVHEAYLRLVDQTQLTWKDRAHFCAIAARCMRFVLVDHARNRNRLKRGGGLHREDLEDNLASKKPNIELLLSVDSALNHLAEHDERLVQVVECRFFSGMTVKETAEALGIGERTVERDWTRAKAYLAYVLKEPPQDGPVN